MIVQRGEFANYLRKNSGVKGDATSSEIQGACSAKLEQCEWPSNASWRRHSRITSSTKSPLRFGLARRMFTSRSVRMSLASLNDWAIEYDVRFSGDWFFLFDAFREANYDFLACHLRDYVDEPDWPRWSLGHPRKSIALGERLRCFNPIFRLSKSALSFLHQSLLGWCGHNEVLLPTLLHHNGFAIADMGGKGRFRPSDLRENFYIESEPNSIGLLDTGTMRYRPPFVTDGCEENKLYHPVKPLSSTLREKISRQCHRWLPSSLVQMLKKVRNTSSARL